MKKRFLAIGLIIIMCLVSFTGCSDADFEQNTAMSTYFHIDDAREYSTTIPTKPRLEERSFDDYAVIPYTGEVQSNYTTQLVINDSTNTVLQADNAFARIYPASVTKIVTALIILEDCNLDEVVTITEPIELEDPQAVKFGFDVGDQATVEEMLNALLLISANDAAIALAKHHSGSVEAFTERMNDRVRELGATHSHFVNPHGLQDENHYTTGYDLYLIFKELLTHETFIAITSQAEHEMHYKNASGVELTAMLDISNEFVAGTVAVPEDVTVIAGKTGTTNEAGSCLILAAKDKKGDTYIVLTCGSVTHNGLYQTMQEQLNLVISTE